MKTKEQLLLEIENASDSIVSQLLDFCLFIKYKKGEIDSFLSEKVTTEDHNILENDPLLSVIGIFDSKPINSEDIDQELY